MSFPVLLDTKGDVANAYGIRGTPAHFLINRAGEIKAFATGYKDMGSKPIQNLIQHMVDDSI
jgi:hypothetical protein